MKSVYSMPHFQSFLFHILVERGGEDNGTEVEFFCKTISCGEIVCVYNNKLRQRRRGGKRHTLAMGKKATVATVPEINLIIHKQNSTTGQPSRPYDKENTKHDV